MGDAERLSVCKGGVGSQRVVPGPVEVAVGLDARVAGGGILGIFHVGDRHGADTLTEEEEVQVLNARLVVIGKRKRSTVLWGSVSSSKAKSDLFFRNIP